MAMVSEISVTYLTFASKPLRVTLQNAFMAQKECSQGSFEDPPDYKHGTPEDPED
jgi:hypothetical protein